MAVSYRTKFPQLNSSHPQISTLWCFSSVSTALWPYGCTSRPSCLHDGTDSPATSSRANDTAAWMFSTSRNRSTCSHVNRPAITEPQSMLAPMLQRGYRRSSRKPFNPSSSDDHNRTSVTHVIYFVQMLSPNNGQVDRDDAPEECGVCQDWLPVDSMNHSAVVPSHPSFSVVCWRQRTPQLPHICARKPLHDSQSAAFFSPKHRISGSFPLKTFLLRGLSARLHPLTSHVPRTFVSAASCQ